MKKVAIAFLIPFLFISCGEDPEVPFIDGQFTSFIEKFVEEGALRGVNLSTDELEALLVDEFSLQVGTERSCGFGWWNYEGQNTPRIEILETESCWIDMTPLEKENFVFHELGHALLERIHTDEVLPNGITPKSIMCGACGNYDVFFAEGSFRNYYFDELFNESIAFPFGDKQFERIVFQEDFENYDNSWEAFEYSDGNWELSSTLDEANINQYSVRWDSSGFQNNETQYSLAINNAGSIIDSAGISVLKRFDIRNYMECSNIVARASIRTEGLTNASFTMGVSLRERKSDGTLERFFIESKRQESFPSINNTFENYESEMYCIPSNTDVVTISFTVYSNTPATVFIDDIVLEIWQ